MLCQKVGSWCIVRNIGTRDFWYCTAFRLFIRLAEIWEDLDAATAAEWILQTENCLTSYAFFYAVWTIVGIISWWTIAFFFYSFSVEECHSHSSEIRNLCLMKIPSETLKKFVIPFQHTYFPKAWQILKLFTRNFNQTSCFWRVLTQWIRYCFLIVYVVCICNVEILVSKCH